MKEIVGVLKQFNGFSYFDEMSGHDRPAGK